MQNHTDESEPSPDPRAKLVLRSRVGKEAVVVSIILLGFAVASAVVHGSYLGLLGAMVVLAGALALRFVPLVSLEGERLEVRKAAGRSKKVHSLHALRGVGPLTRSVLHLQTDEGPLALPVDELSEADCMLLAVALQDRVRPSSGPGDLAPR
jgi:hypothetical protein